MLYGYLNKIFWCSWIIFSSDILFSQIITQSNPQKGIERVFRQEDNWEWGANGYGDFENAVRVFGAEDEIETYTIGKMVYRVFSRGNRNYVEMNAGFPGGVYIYTTESDLTVHPIEFSKSDEPRPIIGNADLMNKLSRGNNHWEWGAYGYGSFDQAAEVLGKTATIIKFTDPANERVHYRLFSHNDINYVEIDYGWQGGVFTYTVYDL
jgi:hypothetical protein